MKKKFSYIVIDGKNEGTCYALWEINEIKIGLAKDLLKEKNCEKFKPLETIAVVYFPNGKIESFSLNQGETNIYFE